MMNLREFGFLCCFLFLSLTAFAQSVEGMVVNESGEAIPFATVQWGANRGVITNMEGRFTVEISQLAKGGQISISCLGYETLEITADQFKGGNIALKESVTELDEVLVSNKELSPSAIVEKMMAAAPELHGERDVYLEFFMREQESQQLEDFQFEMDKVSDAARAERRRLNERIQALTDALKGRRFHFFKEYYGEYAYLKDSSKLRVEKAVILQDTASDVSVEEMTKKLINTIRPYLDTTATYRVKTGMFKIEDSLDAGEIFEQDLDSLRYKSDNLRGSVGYKWKGYQRFYKNEDLDFLQKRNRYSYEMKGYATMDGESVYVIQFAPRRGSAQYRGVMYINVYDFGLMRMEYEMLPGEKSEGVNLKLLLGVKFREDRIQGLAVYQRDERGKYSLRFGRQSEGMYAYIHRPLKFNRNKDTGAGGKQVIKMDFVFEIDMVSTSEFFAVETNRPTPENFDALVQPEFYEPVELKKYDPDLWSGYPIIAPIEEIRSFGGQ